MRRFLRAAHVKSHRASQEPDEMYNAALEEERQVPIEQGAGETQPLDVDVSGTP